MPIVSLEPVEDVRPAPYDLGSLPDLDAKMFLVDVGEPLALTIIHRLDKLPVMVYPVLIEGDVRVWITSITKIGFVVNRSADVRVTLMAA
jgi:hypothetical protein